MESPTEVQPPAATTGDMTKLAAARLSASASRRARAGLGRATDMLRAGWGRLLADRRVAVAVAMLTVGALYAGIAMFRGSERSAVPELSGRDLITLLVQTRGADRLGAGSREALLHARAAVAMGEYGEMLEALEVALKAEPKLAGDEDFFRLALQSFNAGRPGRSQALLQQTERKTAEPLLQAATADYSYRIRHGAADALKLVGVALVDPVPMMLLDVWQHDRCDARRSAANKLLAAARGDARVTAGLDAAARRPSDDGCLKGLVAGQGR